MRSDHMAVVVRLAALREHAIEEIEQARVSPDPREHLLEAQAAIRCALELQQAAA